MKFKMNLNELNEYYASKINIEILD
jgi:hypothetical protein